MHREMHRSTSRRVDTGLASISCGLISSITESRLAGPGLSILVRAMCVKVRDRKKKGKKKPVTQCTICAHLVKCFVALVRWKSQNWATGGSYAADAGWRVTLVLIDHYAAYDWRNRQLIIHRFSYRYVYRSVQHFFHRITFRLCS